MTEEAYVMKVLIVYDSVYGNTEKIAGAIAEAINTFGEARLLRVNKANPLELESIDLLVIGSPTQGGRPTLAIKDFISGIPKSATKGIKIAAFDTRFSTRWARIFGYAAARIGSSVKEMGGRLVAQPEGFFVKGTKGPLKDGEQERAATWAKEIATNSRAVNI